MGTQRVQDLVRHSRNKIRVVQQKVINIVTNCKAWQFTNVVANSRNHKSQLRGKKPQVSWENDFTGIKPDKYGYRYFLVFVDIFSVWTEALSTKYERKSAGSDIEVTWRYPAPVWLSNIDRVSQSLGFVSHVSQSLATLLWSDWKLHCSYRLQSSGYIKGWKEL